jgi:murein DD-endopeptidase MepM/ murein hydrolase activator NlpD
MARTVVPKLPATAPPVAFAWPTPGGEVTSIFGPRWGRHHDGIDISAPEGTPIRASAPGTVVFSGRQRGYGNIVIIEHPQGLSTAYAHNYKNLVTPGTLVSRGSLIALLGRTGRASGPNLHFEVRHGKVARDPMRYLPVGNPVLLASRPATADLGGSIQSWQPKPFSG